VPADQIFVLVLIVAIVLGLGWVSIHSHRRAELEHEETTPDVQESARPERRRRRDR